MTLDAIKKDLQLDLTAITFDLSILDTFSPNPEIKMCVIQKVCHKLIPSPAGENHEGLTLHY